ncbi:cohesin domain-containing protein [Halosolutus gelatinilyticus]|uniref:cohesin domain-containing protein n=1 Tax=Halosolutus gelatinilyticus TaxID=2931975 RepID=UPI001FF104F4|nr:cohesin domain-containing protein [Halosolutus gelatinilyticus]
MTVRKSGPVFAIAVVVIAAAVAIAFVGAAGASDSAAVLEIEPEAAEAPPGETIHVAVEMASDGGYGGAGVERTAIGIEYDPDVLTVETIHRGPWMEQGNETEVVADADVDDEAGYVHIDQRRDPADGGATGNARLVTITFRVAEDADGTESTVAIADVESGLTNNWPLQTFTHDGSVSVSEGADVVDASPPDGPAVVGDANETSGGDGNGDPSAADGEGNDGSAEGTVDSIPSFGITAALVALFVGLFAGGLARRS